MTSGAGRALLAGWFSPLARTALRRADAGAKRCSNNPFVFNLGGYHRRPPTSRRRLNGSSSTNPGHRPRHIRSARTATRRASAPMPCGGSRPNHHLRFLYFDNTMRSLARHRPGHRLGRLHVPAPAPNVESQNQVRDLRAGLRIRVHAQPDVEISGSLGVALHEALAADSPARRRSPARMACLGGVVHQQGARCRCRCRSIGVRAAWAFAPQWVLEGQGQVFKADIGDYDAVTSRPARRRDLDVQPELRRRRRLQPASGRRSTRPKSLQRVPCTISAIRAPNCS